MLNGACYAISVLKNSFQSNVLIEVYYAYVHSILSYAITVWGQATDRQRVFIAQKRAIRLVFGLQYRQSCRPYFKKYGILTLISIYIYKLLSHIHDKKSSLKVCSDVHTYSTRQNSNFALPRPKREMYKKSPMYAGMSLYNLLPSNIKDSRTPSLFRTKIKSLLAENAFYSIEEFRDYCSHI